MSSDLEKARSEATGGAMVRRQLTKPKPIPSDIRLDDQIAIVTGSNTGLGLEASRQLLKLRLSHLVMGVRSQSKGDAAAEALRKQFPHATISVWILDMESYDSVRAFAARCASLPRIDIVILNAGTAGTPNFTPVKATGHEFSMQVNYLSTVLLTMLFLPIFKAKAKANREQGPRPPVLTLVGSDGAYTQTLETDGPVLAQLNNPDNFDQTPTYFKTKLLLALFIPKLAAFVNPNDVLLNVANPGLTKGTGLMRAMPLIARIVMAIFKALLARSVEVGATTYLDAALVQDKESHGRFVSEWTLKPWPALYYAPEGKDVVNRLWQETMEELKFAEPTKILNNMRNSN